MLSSITITFTLTGVVSGTGPPALELFTSLGVVLPVAALAYLLAVPASADWSASAGPASHPSVK